MSERSSSPARGVVCAGSASSSPNVTVLPVASPTPIRRSRAARAEPATAAAAEESKVSAAAPESTRKKSRSAAPLRQLSGTATTPASWQAQWSAAISQRFCMTTASRSPGPSPSAPRPPARRDTVSSHAA